MDTVCTYTIYCNSALDCKVISTCRSNPLSFNHLWLPWRHLYVCSLIFINSHFILCYHSYLDFHVCLWFLLFCFISVSPSNSFSFSAWKSGVWCSVGWTHSCQVSVWSVTRTHTPQQVSQSHGGLRSLCSWKCPMNHKTIIHHVPITSEDGFRKTGLVMKEY